MALLRNGTSLGTNNLRIYAGPNLYTVCRPRWTGPGAMRGLYVGEGTVSAGVGLARTAGRPNGYDTEEAWLLPPEGGGLAAYTVFTHPHELTSNLAMGVAIDTTLASAHTLTLAISTFANLVTAMASSSVLSADLRAKANMVSSMLSAGNLAGAASTFANMVCSMAASGGVTNAELSLVVSMATTMVSSCNTTAAMTLVVGLSCGLLSTCSMSADAKLVTQLAASMAAAGNLTGALGALANLTVTLTAPGGVVAALRGTADLDASMTTSSSTEVLTTAAIAAAVWQYILSGVPAGTHLEDAAAGGGGGGGGATAAEVADAVWSIELPGTYSNPDAGALLALLGRLGSLVARGPQGPMETEMAYLIVPDFAVTLPPDDVQLTWGPHTPATPPTTYTLSKSTDHGKTFTVLDTINHDLAGADFDRNRQVFFYDDATGASGHIYKLVANYGSTPNRPAYAVVSVFPPICTVFGYVFSIDGSPLSVADREVTMQYVDQPYIAMPMTAGVAQAVANVVTRVNSSRANEQGVWQLRGIQGALVDITTSAGTKRVQLLSTEGPVNLADLPGIPITGPREAAATAPQRRGDGRRPR